ncbi:MULTISPECIES: hypothetical protein [Nostocales]|uniref:hypothetical protein n=1 Tax=Nostocales TaxID=1161 RepID=UPI0016841F42|nr:MULTISPECIES: hypothetical protein [Nostocales]MBD2297387.1 hypothetical protein [Nostoc sp. FACHB-190]MBD2486367.1 hypothetical protein [Aulosira sp. FACHB-615]
MSKKTVGESGNYNDELLAEYKFDYQKAKPNRFVKETTSSQAWVSNLIANINFKDSSPN